MGKPKILHSTAVMLCLFGRSVHVCTVHMCLSHRLKGRLMSAIFPSFLKEEQGGIDLSGGKKQKK